jgi:predicted permease
MFTGLTKDLQLNLRALGRSPGFTFAAVGILTLGIGANTTIYTVVHACFFAPAPHIVDPEQLVRANHVVNGEPDWWTYPDYAFFRENATVFTGLCAYEPEDMVLTAATRDGRESVNAWYVSDNYFKVLKIRPEAGRLFGPEEGRVPGEPAVVVVSYGLWQRFMGGSPEAIGSTMRLNGHTFTIVGVAPEGFRGSSPIETAPDVFVPLMMHPVLTPSPVDWLRREKDLRIGWLYVLGRLEPDVTLEAAQAEMESLVASLERVFPPPDWSEEGQGVRLSAHYQFAPELRGRLLALTGMLTVVVGFVLLVACANIAILLLARASARSRDIGIQVALGAQRDRIFRQLFVESLLLSAMGGAGSYIVAFWSADLAAGAFPITFGVDFKPDTGVLAFTLLVAAVAAVFFSVAPSLAAVRTDVVTLIKSRDPGDAHSRLRSFLVVAQVALSLVLVAGAVQFIRSLKNAESVELGFETENRLLVSLNLTHHGYSQEDLDRFVVRALERLRSTPGVVRAATTLLTPFRGQWVSNIRTEGTDPEDDGHRTTFNSISPGYFKTIGIPLVAGRDFTLADHADAPRVAVVNEATVRALWPDGDALGQTFVLSDDRVTVVGIARNAKNNALGEQPRPHIYLPELQPFATFTGRRAFLVQTAGDSGAVAKLVKDEIHALDPDLAFMSVQTMNDCVERVLGKYRVGAKVVSLFGVLALLLGAVGLYGVLSYMVVRRTRTIGIQMALGATRSLVARSVLARGLKLFLMGLIVGMPAALASSRFIESYLYELNPQDPLTYLTVVLVLSVFACLAAFLPAYRASCVHPIEALREE